MSTPVMKTYLINSPGSVSTIKIAKNAQIVNIEKPKADMDKILVHAVINPKNKEEELDIYLVGEGSEIPEKAAIHHSVLRFGSSIYHAFTEH